MKMSPWVRTIFALWLAWVIILTGYQAFVAARFRPQAPDKSLIWTANETIRGSQRGKPTLNEPFLNDHVSWDSEYYLSIAINGYDDPAIGSVGEGELKRTKSYAFMPFYPVMIRLFSIPLGLLGMNAIATATLAGVIVSALGTLGGMLALFDLARKELDEAGSLRAAFYLLIFPSGFFLGQVYTEGLFVGLAFGALALARRNRFGWAALLAVGATWTRAAGAALLIPLVAGWIERGNALDLDLEWRQIYAQGIPWRAVGSAFVSFAPLFAFLAWKLSDLGQGFSFVESAWFGRGLLSFGLTFDSWSAAIDRFLSDNSQATAYYFVEFLAILLSFGSFFAVRKKHPDVAWFSLIVLFMSFTSGPAQGMHRYALAAPSMFLALAGWGRRPAFDKAWTLASVLMMAVFAAMFTFDFWAG